MEPKHDSERRYNELLHSAIDKTVFTDSCGTVRLFSPGYLFPPVHANYVSTSTTPKQAATGSSTPGARCRCGTRRTGRGSTTGRMTLALQAMQMAPVCDRRSRCCSAASVAWTSPSAAGSATIIADSNYSSFSRTVSFSGFDFGCRIGFRLNLVFLFLLFVFFAFASVVRLWLSLVRIQILPPALLFILFFMHFIFIDLFYFYYFLYVGFQFIVDLSLYTKYPNFCPVLHPLPHPGYNTLNNAEEPSKQPRLLALGHLENPHHLISAEQARQRLQCSLHTHARHTHQPTQVPTQQRPISPSTTPGRLPFELSRGNTRT